MATKRASTKKPTSTKETPAKAKASVPKQVATVTTRTVDLQDAIRTRAYQLFVERGQQHGADFEDWLRAEEEILGRFNAA